MSTGGTSWLGPNVYNDIGMEVQYLAEHNKNLPQMPLRLDAIQQTLEA